MTFESIIGKYFKQFPCLETKRLNLFSLDLKYAEGFEFTKDCNNIGLGFDLNRHYWRKGLMKEAIKRIIVFCFENFEIKKMHLENLRENVNCTKLAQSVFFKIMKTTDNVQIMPNHFASIDYYELSHDTFETYQNEFNM